MSRRHLTLAVVAIASLVVSACSASPTAPQSQLKTPAPVNADLITAPVDTTAKSGWIGSGG
jgi:ABC-type phosphate/phosphonate transport system substrate-binding protein